MPKFFIPMEDVQGDSLVIREDAHHILHVLRKEIGAHITVCDGNGQDYECEIVEIMTLNDKINSLFILGAKNYLFGLLKKYDSFDKNQFINNNAIPELTSSEREEFEAIITPDLISKLQENKNQVDAYRIIESLNNYPQSILDFLSKTGD